MVVGTSYLDPTLKRAVHNAAWVCNPRATVEFGTQQGSSSLLIAKAMGPGTRFYTYDTFEPNYSEPPYAETRADYDAAIKTLTDAGLRCQWKVLRLRAEDAWELHNEVDLLHIDICNHYNNVRPLLLQWVAKVNKLIILEGGVHNQWQKRNDFAPFLPVLNEPEIAANFDYKIIRGSGAYEDHAVTFLRRRPLVEE